MNTLSPLNSKLKYCFPRFEILSEPLTQLGVIYELSYLIKQAYKHDYYEAFEVIAEFVWTNREQIHLKAYPLDDRDALLRNPSTESSQYLKKFSKSLHQEVFVPDFSLDKLPKFMPQLMLTISCYSESIVKLFITQCAEFSASDQEFISSISVLVSAYFYYYKSIHGIQFSHYSELAYHFHSKLSQ